MRRDVNHLGILGGSWKERIPQVACGGVLTAICFQVLLGIGKTKVFESGEEVISKLLLACNSEGDRERLPESIHEKAPIFRLDDFLRFVISFEIRIILHNRSAIASKI